MNTPKPFEPFREYRHTGDFEPDAQKAYKIVFGLRVLGWIFLGSICSGALYVSILQNWPRAKTKIEFKQVQPKKSNSQNDPVFRILSEQA